MAMEGMMCKFYRNGSCDCPQFKGMCLYPYHQEICVHFEEVKVDGV